MQWYPLHRRSMPWVGISDPYYIWLSEIILQQTRVEQGTAYYNRFIKAYPTIKDLAEAPLQAVMKMWEGLGYYSRAANLHHTAKEISEKYEGVFPSNYNDLIQLKGIGKYTAHAILSYAFGKPYAVTDSNVLRILARVYGITDATDTPAGKNKIESLAEKLIDKNAPAVFNQAMMDLGATVCKPVPLCNVCPMRQICHAYKHEMTAFFPVREKKVLRKKRHFNFIVFTDGKNVVIEKRSGQDIWKHLYQFPLIESNKPLTEKSLRKQPGFISMTGKTDMVIVSFPVFRQQLTHQSIEARFYLIKKNNLTKFAGKDREVVKIAALKQYSFPGVIRAFLQNNRYF